MSEIEENNVEKDDGDGSEEFMIPGHLNPSPEKFRDWARLDAKSSSDPDSVEYNVYCIEQTFDSGKYPQLSVVQWNPWTCQGGGARSSPFSISFGPSYSQDMVWSRSPTFAPEADCFKVKPTDDAIKPILLSTFKEQGLTEAFNAILPAGLRGRLELSKMEDEIAYEVLYSKLLHHPTITKINVPTAQYCTAALVSLCCNLIINSDTLEEIFFQDIGSLDQQMVQRLFESVKISRNLKALDLRTSRYLETWEKSSSGSRSNKPSIRAEPVLAALKSLEGSSVCPLETLDFGGNTIVASPSVGELMTTLLSSSLGLKRLSFRGCDLTEEVLLVVATELEDNDCLEHLDLSHNTISKEVMEHLVKNTTLKELKLEHCKIDLEIVECLVSSLPQMQRLRHLYMDGNEFTWEPLTETKEAIGTIAMVKALEKHESLLSLKMGEFGMLAGYGMVCCTSPPYSTTLKKDNMAQLRHYLERNRKAGTALMKASSEGQTERVKELLSDMSADINIVDADGDTALMYASRSGHTEIVKLLSEMGSDISIGNKAGNTALMLAYESGHTDTVRLLLNKGADITAANKKGSTAMMWASKSGDTEIVKLLSEKGADCTVSTDYGQTPLMLASSNGHIDTVKLLSDLGADINVDDNGGDTALTLASENGHIDIVKLLSDLGANLDTTRRDGSTALMLASEKGHIDIVKFLSDIGADLTVVGGWRKLSALMLASQNGRTEIAKHLSEKGADIHVADTFYGHTSLLLAANNGHTEIVKHLSDMGADIYVVDKYGQTAVRLAEAKGHSDVVDLLLAIMCNSEIPLDWVRLFVCSNKSSDENESDVDISDSYSEESESDSSDDSEEAPRKNSKDLLHWRRVDIERIQRLLEHPKKENIVNWKNDSVWDGRAMLQCSIIYERWDIADLLHRNGADINIVDKKGWTSLSSASQEGNTQTVKLLLEKGANTSITDKNGMTALMLASKNGHTEIVKLLLEKGADVNVISKDGSTALQVASARNHLEVVWFLVRQYTRLVLEQSE